MPRRTSRSLAALAAAAGLAGCGSASTAELPPAAGPVVRPAGAAPVAPEGRVVALPGRIGSLAFDPDSRALVATVAGPPRLVVLDRRTGRVRRELRLPGAPGRLSVRDGVAFVPLRADGRLLRVDVASGRIRSTVDLPGQADAAAALGDGRVAVLDAAAGRVTLVRGRRITARANVPADGDAALGGPPGFVDPPSVGADLVGAADGDRLGVLSGRARTLDLLDAADDLRRLGTQDVGVGPTRLATAADYVFVTDTDGEALLVVRIRGAEFQLERRARIPDGPYAIAFDTDARRLWLTLTATDEVAELPGTRRPRILRRFPTVARPTEVAVDPDSGRVFVAGGARLQLLDPPADPS